MSKLPVIIGAAALGMAAVTGFVVTQTGGKSTPKVAAAAAGEFNPVVPGEIQVTCAPGASTGTADVSVQASPGATRFKSGDILGPNRRVVVTWDGGRGSATITRFDRSYNAGAGSTFPCPATEGETTTTQFHFQLMAGSNPVGSPVSVATTLRRLGSAS